MSTYTKQDNQPDIQRLFEDLTDETAWYRTDALIARVATMVKDPFIDDDIIAALKDINQQLRVIEKAESEINSIIEELREV